MFGSGQDPDAECGRQQSHQTRDQRAASHSVEGGQEQEEPNDFRGSHDVNSQDRLCGTLEPERRRDERARRSKERERKEPE